MNRQIITAMKPIATGTANISAQIVTSFMGLAFASTPQLANAPRLFARWIANLAP
ncbi:hypothetical protein GT370_15805 [Acidocella sp. MX-AZ03]|uniref:hypothetical protein n=1 Tax=Acidocella sp. MX-AZ03 TaxID=2697363 RepID=UPI0022DE28C0|nr:hypothetical protein [Acidocella sp. MX-AZ03]WBO58608.1 hypothetical protein GT370_15805 [Acidocella sp. MX-AZ03]